MISQLFETLTNAVQSNSWVALGASFLWGVLSVLLSPCHLASIPLVVGFIGQQKEMTTRRAFGISSFFSLGILVSIALIGGVTAYAGKMLGDVGPWTNYMVAGVFLIFGLVLLDVIKLPFSPSADVSKVGKGFVGAFVFGAVFGIALGPCTFAFMAPLLGVIFKTASADAMFAVQSLTLYGLGHCGVIVFAGTFVEFAQEYLNFNQKTSIATKIRKFSGILIILGVLYLIYTAK